MNVISLLTPKSQVDYLYADCTVRQGLEKLRVNSYTAIPVLARDGRYVGTVSEGDFLWYLLEQGGDQRDRLPVRKLMRRGFNPAVSVRVTLEELLERAVRQSFIPVVDDRGAFMGIVTRQTVIRRLAVLRTDFDPAPAEPERPPIIA